jgi:hypothetical protein
VGLEPPRPQRLDRLEEEEEGDDGVGDEVEPEEGPQPRRKVVRDLAAGGEEEEGEVQGAHDDEGEAGLAVGELDEILGVLERVDEGPVALPRVEGADRLGLELGLLPLPLALVAGPRERRLRGASGSLVGHR